MEAENKKETVKDFILELVQENLTLRDQNTDLKFALQRIVDTYDNVEDLAGVIAREALDKYNN